LWRWGGSWSWNGTARPTSRPRPTIRCEVLARNGPVSMPAGRTQGAAPVRRRGPSTGRRQVQAVTVIPMQAGSARLDEVAGPHRAHRRPGGLAAAGRPGRRGRPAPSACRPPCWRSSAALRSYAGPGVTTGPKPALVADPGQLPHRDGDRGPAPRRRHPRVHRGRQAGPRRCGQGRARRRQGRARPGRLKEASGVHDQQPLVAGC
jgi:hypothetical protein